MKLLAVTLPGGQSISPPPGFKTEFTNLGSFISAALNLALFISGTLLLSWLVWGIFQYIFAGGDKEGLSKAKKRITYAIVGFIIIIIAYAVSSYAQTIFPQILPTGVTKVGGP